MAHDGTSTACHQLVGIKSQYLYFYLLLLVKWTTNRIDMLINLSKSVNLLGGYVFCLLWTNWNIDFSSSFALHKQEEILLFRN